MVASAVAGLRGYRFCAARITPLDKGRSLLRAVTLSLLALTSGLTLGLQPKYVS